MMRLARGREIGECPDRGCGKTRVRPRHGGFPEAALSVRSGEWRGRLRSKHANQGVAMMGVTDVIFGETIEPSKPDPKPGR